MFFYTLSSLEPLLFVRWKRTLFFKATLQKKEKYSVLWKMVEFAVFRCYQKPWLIWTWIDNVNTVCWLLSNNTITRDTVEDNTQEFRIAVDTKKLLEQLKLMIQKILLKSLWDNRKLYYQIYGEATDVKKRLLIQ
jgi:hypothetical protein